MLIFLSCQRYHRSWSRERSQTPPHWRKEQQRLKPFNKDGADEDRPQKGPGPRDRRESRDDRQDTIEGRRNNRDERRDGRDRRGDQRDWGSMSHMDREDAKRDRERRQRVDEQRLVMLDYSPHRKNSGLGGGHMVYIRFQAITLLFVSGLKYCLAQLIVITRLCVPRILFATFKVVTGRV